MPTHRSSGRWLRSKHGIQALCSRKSRLIWHLNEHRQSISAPSTSVEHLQAAQQLGAYTHTLPWPLLLLLAPRLHSPWWPLVVFNLNYQWQAAEAR